jgi:hypothetical protein
MLGHTLYKSDTFVNDNIFYLFNKTIYEYDMKSAGYNLSRAYKLLSEDKLEELGRYKKDRRSIEIGNIQRVNPEYKEKLKKAFEEARRIFFEANNLQANEIISIKKDAIFTTKYCNNTKFLDYIEFRPKNEYSSYIRLNKKIELYYSDLQMDIKGFGEDTIAYHSEYMISFIRLFFKKMETEDNQTVLSFMRRFIDKYKRRELPVGYYRRFDRDPRFDVLDDTVKFYEYWEEHKDELDISFNYMEVLLKLIKIPL